MSTETEDPKVEEARIRLVRLALGLQARFDSMTAAAMLLSCAMGLLEDAVGTEATAVYLHELADDLTEAEREAPLAGHA